MIKAVGSVHVNSGLQKPYPEKVSFFLSLYSSEEFDGYDDGHSNIPAMEYKNQLECCIKASSELYWKFQNEYVNLCGEEYNG